MPSIENGGLIDLSEKGGYDLPWWAGGRSNFSCGEPSIRAGSACWPGTGPLPHSGKNWRWGNGEVFRAHDQHLDRDVAIKVLPRGALTDESDRKRLHKEALALSKLNHPNIATIHDFDTQQGVDFLVMEFIPGRTLSDQLAAPLPQDQVTRLGIQLARILPINGLRAVLTRTSFEQPSASPISLSGLLRFSFERRRTSFSSSAY